MTYDLKSKIPPTWCPGCNNYIVFAAIQQALTSLNISKENIVISYDIGCIGNIADFFSTYGVHTLHGRSIPVAVGVKLANPKLTVIAIGGDGGIYGEGLSHLVAAARLNINLTVLVADNRLYSLTTGQTSPTTPKGSKTKSTPLGSPSLALDPLSIVRSANPDVFADEVSCTQPQLVTTAIKSAIAHKGFSILNLSQVCITFGKQLTG